MVDYIIGSKDFVSHLNNWLLKNDQSDADWLANNKNKIPPLFRSYKSILYRGMIVPYEFMSTIEKVGYYQLTKYSSWSKNLQIATKFVTDSAFRIKEKDGVKIILKKVLSPAEQVFDIDGFVSFMGIEQLSFLGFDETNLDSAVKEKEVLGSKNAIKITKKDLILL